MLTSLRFVLASTALLALGLFGCATEEIVPDPDPSAAASAVHTAMPAPAGGMIGTVVETMSSGGYTYVLLDDGSAKTWVAGPQTTVAVGDRIEAPAGSPMHDFTSSTLNRTFETVIFVGSLHAAGAGSAPAPAAAGGAANPHGDVTASAAVTEPVVPLPDGLTVAGVFAEASARSGEEAAVRGRVVKVNRGILGKDWLHLRDGTGSEADATHDLTVTVAPGVTAAVGDLVVVRGAIVTDKDFGAGYVYAVVVEDAAVTVE